MKQKRVKGILKIEENDDTYSLVTPTGTYPLEKEYAIKMISDLNMEVLDIPSDLIRFLIEDFAEHQKEHNDSMEHWIRKYL